MTALHAISNSISSRNADSIPPSPSSSGEFQFESEYVKSLLKERTPSPAHARIEIQGKENLNRWKTPVNASSSLGVSAGRTILGMKEVNSFARSASVMGITGEGQLGQHTTPAVKLSSSYVPELCVLCACFGYFVFWC